eukprot:9302205-Alexandrium_andersonii.AAC.1
MPNADTIDARALELALAQCGTTRTESFIDFLATACGSEGDTVCSYTLGEARRTSCTCAID